jgi:hypothetical protein
MKKSLVIVILMIASSALAQGYPKFYASVGGTPIQVKVGHGTLAWAYCDDDPGSDYLQIWDLKNAPVPGTTPPVASFQWIGNQPLIPPLADGLRFNNGLYVAVTTTAAGATGGGPVPCSFGVK